MPDATEQLRRDLLGAIAADAAATRTGNPNAVRVRGQRRRRARGLLAVTTLLVVAAGAGAALMFPVPDDAVLSRLANGGIAAPVVLDKGRASDGPWTLVVTAQNCIEHTHRYRQEGGCSLAESGRLEDASSFRTEDDGEPILVVNGPLQDGTAKVTISLANRPPVHVTPVAVGGRLYFTARAPADARITGIVAMNASGDVVASLEKVPPPP
jgi:hypothetical protein